LPLVEHEKETVMKTKIIAAAALVATSLSGVAIAQESTVTGAAGGAVTGAIVGGPVGAAVGGVAGAIVGTAVNPPPERVVTYVREVEPPADVVVIEQPLTVGEPIPQTVILTPIPEDPTYAYAIVNDQRVIVDPATNVIVGVY